MGIDPMSGAPQNAWDVIVVGAGAAGLLAATRAAELGRRTLLLEKNRRPGVKILMSGGTRCNLTHATDARGIVQAYGRPGKFLHSALAALGPRDLVELVEAEGVATKIEETGKIFPRSDRAADVLQGLLARLRRSGARLELGQPVTELIRADDGFTLTTPHAVYSAGRAILTTGGQSYPGSGTTGDGYRFAAALGHAIQPLRPALTPITTDAAWVRELTGITAPDVALEVLPIEALASRDRRVTLAGARGSLLFAHFGLSGPVALDVSRAVSGAANPRGLALRCDFLPTTAAAELERLLLLDGGGGRPVSGALGSRLPRRLAEALLRIAGLPPERRLAEVGKTDRARWFEALKRCPIPVSGTRGYAKAEVTAGGVSLEEVDSRTMQSKLVPGLYLAGEVLDLDGPIGGYNFQAAFSTGWLAGAGGAAT
jgi:predicted Rossmann fold flavoprotein